MTTPTDAAMSTPGFEPMRDDEDIRRRLDEIDYLVDDGMAAALFLALTLEQPLLLEGEPGVGKTTAAKALARAMGAPLIRGCSAIRGSDRQ
jgi:MoxR-like ATPase